MRRREVIYIKVITTDIKVEKDHIEERDSLPFKNCNNSLAALATLHNNLAVLELKPAPSFVCNFLTLYHGSSVQFNVEMQDEEMRRRWGFHPSSF